MTEIRSLVENLNPAGAGPAASARALEAGYDLGAQARHIRALGHALIIALQQLRQMLGDTQEECEIIHITYDSKLYDLNIFLDSIDQLVCYEFNRDFYKKYYIVDA